MTKPFDLLITGGQVVSGNLIKPATITVHNGRIAGVHPPNETYPATKVIQADGYHILPGIIDTHVHLRDPAQPEREDFISGTRAAAAGGITTILEMPISEPPVHTAAILADRAVQVQPRALVDFGLYGAIAPDNIGEAAGMAAAGAIAFKTFLTAAPPGRDEEFIGLCCPNIGELPAVMKAVKQTGRLHCFHAEDNSLLETYKAEVLASGRRDGLAHALSRPPIVEDVSVAALMALAAEIGSRVQIVHISSHRAAQIAKVARAQNLPVTVETCPQYLFLTAEALQQHGPFAKCNPALRTTAEMEALWPYLLDGTIDVIGSDHSPYRPSEKEKAQDDIFKAPAGMPGLETLLPLMLTAVNQGKLTLPNLVRLMSERAAALFHLSNKGHIAAGYDADLTLVDMNKAWTFDRHQCFSKAKDNMRAYHGLPMRGQVVTTIVRGSTVYDQGKMVGQPGHGQFLMPNS